MNKDNYASVESSQLLTDNGISISTDVWWCHVRGENWYLLEDPNNSEFDIIISAPSMAEVWRKLPEFIMGDVPDAESNQFPYWDIEITKDGDFTTAQYSGRSGKYENTNPVDALIELLIWVKKRSK
jgi:hypothetical protein